MLRAGSRWTELLVIWSIYSIYSTLELALHTCASRLIRNGLSLYEVASNLGHTDAQTTQRYTHLECTDVSQRARDIMEALNSVPDSSAVEADVPIEGQGS